MRTSIAALFLLAATGSGARPDEEAEADLQEWFSAQGGAGHGGKPKTDDPRPSDPPPIKIPVDPVLTKVLPKETIQAIVQGDLQAYQRVRQAAADGVVAGILKEADGKKVFDAVKVLADTARQDALGGRTRSIALETGSAYQQLLHAADRSMAAAGGAPETAIEVTRAIAADAFEQTRSSEAPFAPRGTGTNFFGSGAPGPSTGPSSMDDTGYLRKVSRDLHIEVPSPGADAGRTQQANGVKILIDDAVLEHALAAQGRDGLLAELGALEDRLLAARDGRDVLRALAEFEEAKKQAFLAEGRRVAPVDELRRVPLRPLLEGLSRFRDRWAERPEALRHLGIRRVHGFLRDAGGDLVLLGRVGEHGDFIRVDDLLTAVAWVWKQNLTPMVSLDPDPALPQGPQYARVVGLPRGSSFARTLLDADYEMKRIVLGLPESRLAVPGLKTLPDLVFRQPEPASVNDRFWLFPAQPGPQEILIGPAGDAALFDLRVQVLTESMVIERGELAGTGRASAVCEEIARSFTERFDAVAAERPVFHALRGLFDLVLFAKLLRKLAPADRLLAALSTFPTTAVEVPAYYPAVAITHAQGDRVVTLSGGCDLDVRLRPRALLQVAELPLGSLPAPSPGRTARDDGLIETAVSLIDQGRFAEARARYDEAVGRTPDDPHAYVGRALASVLLGRPRDGVNDAAWALRLEPGHPRAQAVLAFSLTESGRKDVLPRLSPAARAELVELLLRRSGAELGIGRDERALALADRAVEARPEDPRALVERARLKLLLNDLDGVEHDAGQALRVGEDPAARVVRARARFQRGAYAEAEADLTAVLREVDLPDLHGFRGLVRLRAGRPGPAAEDVRKALASGPASMGTLMVARAARLVRSLGPESAWAILDPGLRLSPRLQEVVATALEGSTSGDPGSAVAALETGLAELDRMEGKGGSPGGVRDFLELRLSALLIRGEPRRALARLDALSRRQPAWLSPEIMRAAVLSESGDPQGAVRVLRTWDGKSPAGDVALAQFIGNLADPAAGVELLRGLFLMELGPPGRADLPASLRRLEARLGPEAAPAVRALVAFYESPQEAVAPIRSAWETLRSTPPGTLELKLLRVLFLAHAAAATGSEEYAAALRGVSFASTPNPLVDRAVPALRANALDAVMRQYRKELPKDPRFVSAVAGLKEYGPALTAELQALEDAWVARARKSGDPVLVFQVRDEIRTIRGRVLAEAAGRSLAQVEKLIDVVLDPKKLKDLEARRDALRKAADGAASGGEEIRRGVADTLDGLKETLDLETFKEVVERAARHAPESARFYVLPDGFSRKLAESYLD